MLPPINSGPAMDRIGLLCAFSLQFLYYTSADRADAVGLYGGSSIGRCLATGPGITAEGDNLTCVGNYSDLRDALKELERSEATFSHFTVCLGGDVGRTYVLPSVNLTASLGILTAGLRRSKIYCSSELGKKYSTFFYGSEEVRLENLNFEGCASPIGLELVQSVAISNCSFRWVEKYLWRRALVYFTFGLSNHSL